MDDGKPWPDVFIQIVPGILAILFSAAYCFAFVRGMYLGEGKAIVEAQGFAAVVSGIVSFWFAQKGQADAAKQATVAVASAAQATAQAAGTGAGNGGTKLPEVKP